jgi:hypothetical protein
MSWVLCPDESVGTLPYISNSWARRLASRLSEKLHAHHNLIAPKTSVPLDHNSSRESGMLRVPQWWYAIFRHRAGRTRRATTLNGVGPGERQ